jgi:hypothetical protein
MTAGIIRKNGASPVSRPTFAIALLLAAATLAGCVDHSRAREQAGTVRLTLGEYRITPQNALVTKMPVTFVVRNSGRLAHDLRIKRGDHVIGGTTTIAPGATQRKTFHHLTRGKYRLFSSLRRDELLGQYGELIVR